jgi:regulator of sigma E protease
MYRMNIVYFLVAIPMFGLLILVHEFGHFITAKWSGIRVDEFGLGFPPRFIGIRRSLSGKREVLFFRGNASQRDAQGGTIYSLNLLPIGGFVRMPGEDGELTDARGIPDSATFAAQPAYKRILVLSAGVIMNILLAIVLFSIAFQLGQPSYPPVIDSVVAGSPAALAGIRANDTILRVNNQSVSSLIDVQNDVATAITRNPEKLSSIPIVFLIRRPHVSSPITLTIAARVHPPAGQGPLGIVGKEVMVRSPIWEAPLQGAQYTFTTTAAFFSQIGQIIVGAAKPQFAGPVGIVKITGEVAQSVPVNGIQPLLMLTALLSLNLAVINILPIPALDGGRILFILIELVRGGKRLKPERENLINLAGMALLLGLMVVITISDIFHWNG